MFWLGVSTEIGLKAFKTGVLTLMFGATETKKLPPHKRIWPTTW